MPKLTVVVSQSQGKNPAKARLEEEIAAALLFDPEIDVSLVPHLYDMHADHPGLLYLRGIGGPLVVLSWLYPRAARWTLDRQGIKGREGTTLLRSEGEDESDDDSEEPEASATGAIGSQGKVPNRSIWCLDLRAYTDAQTYLDEIRRIAAEQSVTTVGLSLSLSNGNGDRRVSAPRVAAQPATQLEPTKRRWYPVIDYSRCTNCMECIDFCLFGVYGLDHSGTILVEQQDNCKKGCPACSRVCPANAIIFPQHKTPAIAGANGEVTNLKIDLSKLFGGEEKDPLSLAVAERDAELVADGRDAVGMSVGVPKRQTGRDKPRDALDDLIDGLDSFDL
jgi:NAD-dependent dihydropyrimidine dehydrogenase PreA subunit